MTTLGAAAQAITFGEAPSGVVAAYTAGDNGAVDGYVSATATSGLGVTFSSLTPAVCQVTYDGYYGGYNYVVGLSAGTCTIAANQPGGVANSIVYGAAAQVTQSFSVTGLVAATQTITFGVAPTGVVAALTQGDTGAVDGIVSAAATSGGNITFTSLTPAVCQASYTMAPQSSAWRRAPAPSRPTSPAEWLARSPTARRRRSRRASRSRASPRRRRSSRSTRRRSGSLRR